MKWSSEIIPASETVCSKEWKYVHWVVSNTEELFDLKNDPIEGKKEFDGASIEQLKDMPYGEPQTGP